MKFNLKKVSLSVVITLTLALTFSGSCWGAPYQFTDLANVTAKDKIIALAEKGYISGVGGQLFAPNSPTTDAQGIAMMVKAFDINLDNVRFIKQPKATDYFKNADNDAWYANALIIASVKGLDFSPELNPNQRLTREEFTYHLIQAMESHYNLPMIKLIPVEIADQAALRVDYNGAIQRALSYKVTKLNTDGKFNPKGEITRAEAAEQIYNALEYLKAHNE